MPFNSGPWRKSDVSDSVVKAMTTDPEEIRARIDAILAELPDPANPEKMPSEADLEELARQLSEAHDMLVQALESAEKA